MLLCIIQGSLTGLHCRDEIVCPLIQSAQQAMGPGATLCRTTVPLLTELGSSQISHRAQVITDFSQSSGHHRFLTELRVITDFLLPTPQIWLQSIFGQRVAKNYLTPVDVYQLTRVLQQVWQSKLQTLVLSTSQCCIECLSDNGGHTCYGLPWTWVASVTLKKKGGVIS